MKSEESPVLSVDEDIEFDLNQGCAKLSIYVYALRTFKEDLLVCFNDLSLRKPLATDGVKSFFVNKV